jgi:NAD(P)-dependent dehydrogenase (short-subunit alcohol dehydrogenase family)
MGNIDLDGTVVAMTGASVGLGKSMSLALAKAGARVVLAAPELDLIEVVASEIEATAGPGRALPVKTDITVRTECERMLAESIRYFGKLQVLVNNARRPVRGPGLPPAGNFLPFWESNPYIWQESVQVNVNGTFLVSHVVTPHLIANGWGRIVNINTSLNGLVQRRNSPYGVTKAALESATLIFAADLAGTGVTVNTLLPGGPCETDPNRPYDPKLKLLPVDIMDPAIVWLASKRSDSKTGGRYIGRLWNDKLPPDEAAAGAFTPPVFRSGD